MKKSNQKPLTSFLILIAIVISLLIPVFSIRVQATQEGASFTPSTSNRIKYSMSNVIESVPKTFEATVKIATDYETSHPIISSYVNAGMTAFSFAINESGQPYLSIVAEDHAVHQATFEELDVRTGEWVHIGVVIDTDRVFCYINGELKGTEVVTLPTDTAINHAAIIGGSYSAVAFFDGSIMNAALFSEPRSADEIASDFAIAPSGDGLLCHYDFSSYDSESYASTVNDLSSHGNHLTILQEFYDEPLVELDEYAYSMALVGDVQIVNRYAPENLTKIYDWLLENKDEKKIAFAANLGDLTDRSTDAEWENVKTALHKLDGVIPYSIVRGNHDYINDYNKFFPYEDYTELVDGAFNGNMLNSYQTFEVCGNKYLVLNLDIKNSYESIEWANWVVSTHHDYNVIVTTHIHLSSSGEQIDANVSLAPTSFGAIYNCDELWDAFFSKHKNIFMIISGHVASNSILTRKLVGEHGNTVTQMLVNPQGLDRTFQDEGGLGIVAMLYFSADGKSVQTQFYSTIRDQYYLTPNEYRIELDPIQTNGVAVPEYHNLQVAYDSDVHWEECLCGVKKNTEPHNITWTVLTEATEEKSGRRRAECSCGYNRIESYDYVPPIIEEVTKPKSNAPILIVSGASAAVICAGTVTAVIIVKKKKSKK